MGGWSGHVGHTSSCQSPCFGSSIKPWELWKREEKFSPTLDNLVWRLRVTPLPQEWGPSCWQLPLPSGSRGVAWPCLPQLLCCHLRFIPHPWMPGSFSLETTPGKNTTSNHPSGRWRRKIHNENTPADQARGQQRGLLCAYCCRLSGWCKLWGSGGQQCRAQNPRAGAQEGPVLELWWNHFQIRPTHQVV